MKATELLIGRTLLPLDNRVCVRIHTVQMILSACSFFSAINAPTEMMSYQTAGVALNYFFDAHNLCLRIHKGSVIGPFDF